AAATITTAGQGAVGLYASDAMATGHGGDITVSGQLTVTTGTALNSYGAWAESAGSTIALNGPSAFTINGGAFALYASQGGPFRPPTRWASSSMATLRAALRSTAREVRRR